MPTKRHLPLRAIVPMVLMWLLLWAGYSPVTVLGGVLCALVVLYVFPLPSLGFEAKLRPWHATVCLSRFVYDLVTASFQIAWWGLRPGPPPLSAIVELRLKSDSMLILTLTAEALSLVPGSVVVEASQTEHTLYLHFFGINSAEDLHRTREAAFAQELRIVKAIGSDAELANYGRERAS